MFPLCCRWLSPLDSRDSDDEFDDTDEELYYLQKCQASKNPLFIPIESHSLAPALFYCIRTTTIQLLHAAVVEPLSSAWPVIATVNRWNPLAWVGVVWAQPTPFNLLLDALAQNTFILPCHYHASYCCIALIVFPLCCRWLSPLDSRDSDDEFDDTDEELYYLQKCQASKNPLFIPIESHSLAPALFYCIRTTTIQLLHAAVVEPLSSAWPVIATVNRWNPLAWVGVVWALMCLLIHACLSCLLLLRVGAYSFMLVCHACYCLELSQVWFIGDESEVCEHVLLCVS